MGEFSKAAMPQDDIKTDIATLTYRLNLVDLTLQGFVATPVFDNDNRVIAIEITGLCMQKAIFNERFLTAMADQYGPKKLARMLDKAIDSISRDRLTIAIRKSIS